jgi:hypothetical protein
MLTVVFSWRCQRCNLEIEKSNKSQANTHKRLCQRLEQACEYPILEGQHHDFGKYTILRMNDEKFHCQFCAYMTDNGDYMKVRGAHYFFVYLSDLLQRTMRAGVPRFK